VGIFTFLGGKKATRSLYMKDARSRYGDKGVCRVSGGGQRTVKGERRGESVCLNRMREANEQAMEEGFNFRSVWNRRRRKRKKRDKRRKETTTVVLVLNGGHRPDLCMRKQI